MQLSTVFLLLHFTQCSCKDLPTVDDADSIQENDHILSLALNSKDQIIDNNWIDFEIINHSTEKVDLKKLQVLFQLADEQYFNEQPNNTCQIVCAHSKKVIPQRQLTELANLTNTTHLAVGVNTNISLRAIEIENLANAKLACQIQDEQGNILCQKEVLIKFTNPVGPIPGKTTAVGNIKDESILLDIKTSSLIFDLQIKNTSDHPIDLSNLQYTYQFVDFFQGHANPSTEQLLENMNSILASNASVDIPVRINLAQEDQSTINRLMKRINTKELAINSDLIMSNNQILTNINQKVQLIASGLGPIIGKTTLTPQLNITQVLLKAEVISLPIILFNTSDHAIDLNQIKYNLTIKIKNKTYEQEYLGKDITPNILLYERGSYTVDIKLDTAVSKRMMKGNPFTCQLDVLTADGSYSLGKLKQKELKLIIGPFDQPNVLAVKLEKPIIAYNQILNCYQIQSPIAIENTSPYPINMANVFYAFEAQIQGLPPIKNHIKGSELEKKPYILLGQGEKYTINLLTYDLPKDYTKQQAEDFLAKHNINTSIVIKTIDKQNILGTDQSSN